MRRFAYSVIDSVTRKTMVLCDASYNNACWYIDSLAEQHNFRVLGTETRNDLTIIKCTSGITFYYDEARGFLMKD